MQLLRMTDQIRGNGQTDGRTNKFPYGNTREDF